MKRFVAILFLGLFGFGSGAWAGGNAGYDHGFYIKSDDGDFQLNLNGRVQPLFFVEKATDSKSQFNFQMRRAAVGLKASIQKRLTLAATLMHSPNPEYNNAQFAYVTAAYEFDTSFVVTAGMIGLPLDLLAMMSSNDFLFVDGPLTATRTDDAIPRVTVTRYSFGAPDGLGVGFSGDIDRIHYNFKLVNANENNFNIESGNRKVSVGGNLAFDILDSAIGTHSDLAFSESPKWTGSVGFNYRGKKIDSDKNDAGVETLSGATINRIVTGSAGMQYRYLGFSLNVEGYARKTDFADRGTASAIVVPDLNLTDLGYYLTSGYFLVPKKLEGAAAWSYIRREGLDNDSYEVGGGLNYYLRGRDLRLNLQYTRSTFYQDIIGTRNKNVNKVVLGANVLF